MNLHLLNRVLTEGGMSKREVQEADEEWFEKHPGRKREAEKAPPSYWRIVPPGGTGSPNYPGKHSLA